MADNTRMEIFLLPLQPRGPNPEMCTTSKGSSKSFTAAIWSRLDINKGNNT